MSASSSGLAPPSRTSTKSVPDSLTKVLSIARRELKSSDEVAAVQEQLEFVLRQRNAIAVGELPQRKEPRAFEPLGVDAQARAVEVQHLGLRPQFVREQDCLETECGPRTGAFSDVCSPTSASTTPCPSS